MLKVLHREQSKLLFHIKESLNPENRKKSGKNPENLEKSGKIRENPGKSGKNPETG